MSELLFLLLPGSVLGAWALVRAVRRGPRAVGKLAVRRASYRAAPKLTRAAYDLRAASRGPGAYGRRVVRRDVRRTVCRAVRRSRLW